ncbi:hypothetical protein D3C75_1298520 [compost metagenome]
MALRVAENAPTEAVLMIEPPPEAIISGKACFIMRNAPRWLTPITRSQSSRDTAWVGSACRGPMPALFTSTLRRP